MNQARMRRWRIGLGVLGTLLIAYGLRGILTGGVATAPRDTARWLLGGVVAHDLLLAPLVAVAGWVIARTVPRTMRPAIQGGLFVAGVLVLVAIPVLSGRGGHGNSSSNPLDYPRNLTIALGAVAIGSALAVAVLRAQRRSSLRSRFESSRMRSVRRRGVRNS
jgi:hypothetical protein